MDRRVPALFALTVAILLLSSTVVLALPAEEPTYQHSIEQVEQSSIPERATLLHYDDLSSEAQTAIDDAINRDGEISGRENKPPEFAYSDAVSINNGIYFVEYRGDYFRLTTFSGPGFVLAGLLVKVSMVALGLTVGLVGGLSYGTDRQWLPVGFGTFGLLVLIASRVTPVENWAFLVMAANGLGALAGVSAIGALVENRSVKIAIAGGMSVFGILLAVKFLGVLGGVPRVLVSPIFLGGFGILVGVLAFGHLLGVGYERWIEGE